MNRLSNFPKVMILAWLSCTLVSGPVRSQLASATSVPEPTELAVAAAATGSVISSIEMLGEVESTDGRVLFAAIEAGPPGEDSVRGIRIGLEDSEASDALFLAQNQLADFRDELEELDWTSQFNRECRATYRCVHGIARCGPARTERQAYCPGRYSTSGSEAGFVLSTPRTRFEFPSVEPAQLIALIDDAVRVLERAPD